MSAGPAGGLIGQRAAQRLARHELSKVMYHPHQSFATRILNDVNRWLQRLSNAQQSPVPGGWWTLVALAALAVLLIAGVLAWTGPLWRQRRQSGGLLGGARARTAGEHREEASRLAQAGDYSGAIIESVRAIVAGLEEDGALLQQAGRTADEFAAEAGELLPDLAARLGRAARLFDGIAYGQRPGTPESYQRVRDLEVSVRASGTLAKPLAGAASAAGDPA